MVSPAAKAAMNPLAWSDSANRECGERDAEYVHRLVVPPNAVAASHCFEEPYREISSRHTGSGPQHEHIQRHSAHLPDGRSRLPHEGHRNHDDRQQNRVVQAALDPEGCSGSPAGLRVGGSGRAS